MAGRRTQNQKGGIITDPQKYLENCFPEKQFELLAAQSIYLKDVGALRQRDYETKNGKAVPNCTLSSICNAMAYFARNGWGDLPQDSQDLYPIVRKKAQKYRLLGRYGTILFFNRMLVNGIWKKYGYGKTRGKSGYLRGFMHWDALMKEKKPFIISFVAGKYARHTVCACGMLVFTDGFRQYRFLAIRDNWGSELRFLSDLERYIACTTQFS